MGYMYIIREEGGEEGMVDKYRAGRSQNLFGSRVRYGSRD